MSLKRTKTPPTTKRTTTTKKKSEPARQAPGAQAGQQLAQTLATRQQARLNNAFTDPANVLILPAPALVQERREADELIKKLTDTLPTRLDDETAMGQASEHLVIARKLRKLFESKLTELKQPIKKAMDDLANDYNPYIVRLKSAEEKVNQLISDYRAEATRKQQLEDQRIAEEHRKTMDEARAQGVNPLSIPVPWAAPAPPVGFQTAHGKTTTMRVPRWKCTDPTQVPYEYNGVKLWILNDAGIGTLRRGAGVEAVSPIPGIEYYYDETTVVK